ncbi:MAG: AI-2E family transporter [Rickettsiales bacterium]
MKSDINRNIFFIFAISIFIYLFYLSWNVIAPFLGSFVIAYLFSPVAEKIHEKTKISRWFISLLIVAVIFILFILIWVTLIPVIYDQIAHFAGNIPQYKVFIKSNVYPKVESIVRKFDASYVTKLKQNLDNVFTIFFQAGVDLLNKIWKSGYAVINIITAIFLVPLVSFYMIRDWNKIYDNVLDIVPVKSKSNIRKLFNDINRALSGFIRGQLNICIILAIFYSIALSVIGLKYGVFIGITTGLISFIPFIGLTSGFIISLIVSYFQDASWHGVMMVCVVFGIGNLIESLISPKIVGNKVGLHPIWVIFALIVGASTLGFFGMLVAIPVAAVLGVILRFFIEMYKDSSLFSNKKRK